MRHAIGLAARCARLLALSLTMLAPAVVHADELRIVPNALPWAELGTRYLWKLDAEGGTPPYSWSTEPGALPGDIVLRSDGVLTGMVRDPFHGVVRFEVTDRAGGIAHADLAFDAGVKMVPPRIEIGIEPQAPELVLGQPVAGFAFTASGGTPPYEWLGSEPPPGLDLRTDGVVSGTPGRAGSFAWNLRVRDSTGMSQAFFVSMLISSDRALTVGPRVLPDAVVGEPYEATLESDAEGSAEFVAATWGRALPAGLVLEADGTISGIPTGEELKGKRQELVVFDVRVIDEAYREGTAGLMLRLIAPDPDPAEPSADKGGCQSAGDGLGLLGLAVFAGAAFVRRRRPA